MQPSHSISNISDAIRSHIHRDSLSSLGRHLFSPSRGNDLSLKNVEFANVSAAVTHLFQKKQLKENELQSLQESVRNITTTEMGPLIYDYYKDHLIKKGMVILREDIKQEIGHSLLKMLGEQWDYFYREILPVLHALLYPVKRKPLTIKQVALLEFRNTVVLKLPVKEALQKLSQSDPVSPPIQQMLLVLHGVHEYPYTENSIELEKMVARVTSPHLGIMGLYVDGKDVPEIESNFKLPQLTIPVIRISDETTALDDEVASLDQRLKRAGVSPQEYRLQHKRSSGLLPNPLLEAVKEQDRGQIRRYSIAAT